MLSSEREEPVLLLRCSRSRFARYGLLQISKGNYCSANIDRDPTSCEVGATPSKEDMNSVVFPLMIDSRLVAVPISSSSSKSLARDWLLLEDDQLKVLRSPVNFAYRKDSMPNNRSVLAAGTALGFSPEKPTEKKQPWERPWSHSRELYQLEIFRDR